MIAAAKSEFIPVVRKKDEHLYDPKQKKKLLQYLISTTRDYLQQPGSIYGVAPMGTRSHVLKAERVNTGFLKVAQKHQIPSMPIAFTKVEKRLSMSAGEVIPSPKENEDITQATDFYMSSLAQMIPKELRGDYL